MKLKIPPKMSKKHFHFNIDFWTTYKEYEEEKKTIQIKTKIQEDNMERKGSMKQAKWKKKQ